MKRIVLYIDMMYRGGAQRVMAIIANYLAERSWDVILVNDFLPDPKVMQYQVSEKVRRVFLRKDLGGNVIKKNFERLSALRKLVKDEKPNVVLSFLGRPNKRMLIATTGLHCRKIVSIRNDPSKEYGSSWLKRCVTNLLFHLANGYVFQTEDASKYFDSAIQKKAVIILNPIDDQFYAIKRNHHPKNIISVGRLEEQKNHQLLIDAFAEVKDYFPSENLIIYGEGNLRGKLEKQIRDLGLEERVFLPGSTSDIGQKLSLAKVFVLSSDYEGLPNALMEAMAAGVPCISTDCPCGGPKSLIRNSKEGMLVPCNDANQMAKSLFVALSDPKIEEIGKNARKRAIEFGSDSVMNKWVDYLTK